MDPLLDLPRAVSFYVVFLLSTTLHEAAHAWAAKVGGDLTAYHGGQVSLDPRPHIRREPFGMVVLPLLGVLLSGFPYGFASAPYDANWAQRHPKRAAWMALAGPASNLVLLLLAAVLIRIGAGAGVLEAPSSVNFGHVAESSLPGIWMGVATFLSVFFSLNLLLTIFNLIPVPPLDGSGALPLLMSDDASRRYQNFLWSNPALQWVGLLVAWQLLGPVFQPIFLAAVNLLYPGMTYG